MFRQQRAVGRPHLDASQVIGLMEAWKPGVWRTFLKHLVPLASAFTFRGARDLQKSDCLNTECCQPGLT